MGVPVVGGCDFIADDRQNTQAVAIVNREFVRRNMNGKDPLRASFAWGDPTIKRSRTGPSSASSATSGTDRSRRRPSPASTFRRDRFRFRSAQRLGEMATRPALGATPTQSLLAVDAPRPVARPSAWSSVCRPHTREAAPSQACRTAIPACRAARIDPILALRGN